MNTRIHHLNCLTLHPRIAAGGRLAPVRWVAHVLLVERSDGLVLVDSGLGTDDLASLKRLGRSWGLSMNPDRNPDATALRQIEGMGFTRDDVRHVVLTHMDVDHVGGISDFPKARIHVDATEHLAAEKPRTLMEKQRYVRLQWAHHPDWELHGSGGDDWFGFEGVRGVDDSVMLVPLRGHSRGHSGVAVRRPEGGWLLHAGDSYFYKGEVETPPSYTKAQVALQKMVATDEESRRSNQARLRELRSGHPEVTLFSAHDAEEYDRLAAG